MVAVLAPLPELPPLARPAQLLYLFFQSLMPTIGVVPDVRDHAVVSDLRDRFPRMQGIDPLTDQMIAEARDEARGRRIAVGDDRGDVFFRWGEEETTEVGTRSGSAGVGTRFRTGMGR